MHTRAGCPSPRPCTRPETPEQPPGEQKPPLGRDPSKNAPAPLHKLTFARHGQNTWGSCARARFPGAPLFPGSDQMIFCRPIVLGVVQEGDIDLVRICCFNESQVLSASRGALEVPAGPGRLRLTCISGRVGISADLGNRCFLRFLKEITLIAASPVSLQTADAIGSPQMPARDDGMFPTALPLPLSAAGPALSRRGSARPKPPSPLRDKIVSALVHLLAAEGERG